MQKARQERGPRHQYELQYDAGSTQGLPKSLTLTRLEPGRYELSVLRPGCVPYSSGLFEVKVGEAPLVVKLKAAGQ